MRIFMRMGGRVVAGGLCLHDDMMIPTVQLEVFCVLCCDVHPSADGDTSIAPSPAKSSRAIQPFHVVICPMPRSALCSCT